MKNKPLISVCMLTYNHENYITEAIQSVKNQTYINWELIIVDNNSTDNTRSVIEKQIKNDSRIKFLPQSQNLYVSKGANISIEAAKGEYIALFSGDDIFVPQKLEKQLNYMLEKDLDISFSYMDIIDSNSKEASPEVSKWFNTSNASNNIEILRAFFMSHNVTYSPTALMRKNKLFEVGLFDHRLLQTQDIELWVRFLANSSKVEIIHEKLLKYRVLDNRENLSSNNTFSKRNRTDIEFLYVWKQLILLENKLLSEVFECEVSDNNKYEIIFDYTKCHNIHTRQLEVVLEAFEKLGSNCDVTSPLFNFFFNNYGEVGVSDNKNILEKNKYILLLEEQLDKHVIVIKEKESIINNYQKLIIKVDESIARLEKEMSFKKTLIRLIKYILGRI